MSKIGTGHGAPSQAAEVRDLGNGIYQLPTDYPEVCNAPLWTYLLADGGRFGLVDPGIASTLEATLAGAIQAVGFTAGPADILLATQRPPGHPVGPGRLRALGPGARAAAPVAGTPRRGSVPRRYKRLSGEYP